MELAFCIALLAIGFILILVELFVVPGTSVIGFMGFAGWIYGIYEIFVNYGTTAGWIALGSVLIVCIILTIWVLKTKSWRKLMLEDKLESKVNVIDNQKIKVGDEGKSVSRLAPMGHAMFDGEMFEVQSIDGYIDPKISVKVMKIENNKIFVTIL